MDRIAVIVDHPKASCKARFQVLEEENQRNVDESNYLASDKLRDFKISLICSKRLVPSFLGKHIKNVRERTGTTVKLHSVDNHKLINISAIEKHGDVKSRVVEAGVMCIQFFMSKCRDPHLPSIKIVGNLIDPYYLMEVNKTSRAVGIVDDSNVGGRAIAEERVTKFFTVLASYLRRRAFRKGNRFH